MRVHKKAAAWEQVNRNDAALTDVGQLFISLPKCVPIGGRRSAHMLRSLGYWLDFGYH